MFKKKEKKLQKQKDTSRMSIEDSHVGARLYLRRNELGISQSQLAKFENLTFQQVQKYEKGSNRISSGRLYRFARILHVPISYFFEGMEDQGVKEINKSLQNDMRQINKLIPQIKQPHLRKSIIALAKSLAGVDNV